MKGPWIKLGSNRSNGLCPIMTLLPNEFPAFWEFLNPLEFSDIPRNSKLCKLLWTKSSPVIVRIAMILLRTPSPPRKGTVFINFWWVSCFTSLIYLFLLIGEDYQELTQQEENDLEHMISQTEDAISNIEAFTEQLSKDLSSLDGVMHEIKILIFYNSLNNL